MKQKTTHNPVSTLFRNDRRQRLIQEFVAAGKGTPLQLADLKHRTGYSRETIRMETSADPTDLPLLQYGLITVLNPDKQIPHYALADTPPSNYLLENAAALSEVESVFTSPARSELITYFMRDPSVWANQHTVTKETTVAHKTCRQHLPDMVTRGVLKTREGASTTEYRLAETALTAFLTALNERCKQF